MHCASAVAGPRDQMRASAMAEISASVIMQAMKANRPLFMYMWGARDSNPALSVKSAEHHHQCLRPLFLASST